MHAVPTSPDGQANPPCSIQPRRKPTPLPRIISGTLHLLTLTDTGMSVGDETSIESVARQDEHPPAEFMIVTLARAFDATMDINHVTGAYDLARRVSPLVVLITKPGPDAARYGSGVSPMEIRYAIDRLGKRGLRLYEASESLIKSLRVEANGAFAGSGLRNGLHRIRTSDCVLLRSWVAPHYVPNMDHREGVYVVQGKTA